MAIKDYSSKRYMSIEEQRNEINDFFKSEDFYNILSLLSLDEEEFFNTLEKWKGGDNT
jgi:hypothetical protein